MKLLLLALFVAPSLAIIEYNETEARLLLEASAAAYSKNPLTCLNKAFPSGHGFEVKNAGQDIPCDSAGNTCSYYVAVSIPRKEILIAFRGTVGTDQFNKEVEASLHPKEEFKKYGKVNKYFWDAFNLLWSRLSTTLNEKSTEDYKIVFTGYSLGGALASLGAMKTYADLIRPTELIKLVTFGEPRVGNPTYATNFDRAVQYSYRVVHKADQVPHMPPCKDGADKLSCEHTALDRSYHHGKEVWYNNDMNPGDSYLVLTDSDEDVKGSNSITPKYELKDHLTYFGRVVGDYGTADCNEAAVAKPKSAPVTSLASFLVLLVLYVLA